MSRKPHLCEADKEAAVKKYLDKKGTANEIASQYKIGVSTLQRWVKNYKEGKLHSAKKFESEADKDEYIRNIETELADIKNKYEILKKVLPLFIK